MKNAYLKQIAKLIVKYALKLSGPQGWVASFIITRLLEWGYLEAKDIVQEIIDNHAVDNHKEEIPNGNTPARKELENSIITGDKP